MPEDLPDLDLIRRVQKARMLHDADATPSQISAVYWIEAKPAGGPPPTSRAGQWVITTTLQDVDALWKAIKAATEAGTLGYKSKVSTASRSGRSDAREIRVVTADADDLPDVERVRKALQLLSVGPMHYQRTED